MNKIDFKNLAGFPGTQYTLDYMQKAYSEALGALALLAGNGVIISGMTETGNNISGGWIAYDGELIPFEAGIKQATFIIEEIPETRRFGDDVVRPVYFTRTARFAAGGILYSSLIRLDTIAAIKSELSNLNTVLSNISTSLNSHIANNNNPHGTTAAQVGLGNLPNAKSDSYQLNNSNSLATSKSVYELWQNTNTILATGAVDCGVVNPGDRQITVSHNKNIVVPYMVVGSLRGYGADWNADNDTMAVYRNPTSNAFTLTLRNIGSASARLIYDYLLVKR